MKNSLEHCDPSVDWSEPRVPRVALTQRNIHFLKTPSEAALKAQVIVGLTHRNHPEELREALRSALEQDVTQSVVFLVLDDSSDEGWMRTLEDPLVSDPRLVVAAGHFGSPPQARNALLDLVDQQFPSARWVARMDADDRFATAGSLQALVHAGDASNSSFVIGSNHLSVNGTVLPSVNFARAETLQDRQRLNTFIQSFCRQEIPNELPSCNLLLRTQSGIRYPNASSAEDHWLVAGLFMHRPQDGCVVTEPVYAIYSLEGEATRANKKVENWTTSRLALAHAAEAWHRAHQISNSTVLGWGQEGVVWRESTGTYKRFYSNSLTKDDLSRCKRLVEAAGNAIIPFSVCNDDGRGALIQLAQSPLQETEQYWPLERTKQFLKKLYKAGVVTSNVKRDNLRFTSTGDLQYIDIGRDIVPLTASRFLDCAARLYAISELGWSDHELARRRTVERPAEVLEAIPGFSSFYSGLVHALHPGCKLDAFDALPVTAPPAHPDVTLLIKCCPQDADSLDLQVHHIVGELRLRARFGKTVLTVDPFEGPYLRQHSMGSLSQLKLIAERLLAAGLIDEVWFAPTDHDSIANVYWQWFGILGMTASHTAQGAPIFSQLWAFDRIKTPFVLQLDVDVLVGGNDIRHDVVRDMKRACLEPEVWCVGFNIPQINNGFKPYIGEPSQFAPEVRFGLLNLERVKACAPFENPVIEGRLALMWHRSLKHAQLRIGMRSVRGGDSRTFYIHPKNEDKGLNFIALARDLIAQCSLPEAQRGAWDLVPSTNWERIYRHESIVFLLFGRETPIGKLERCLASLKEQSSQDFGIVFIDDGGCPLQAAELPHRMSWLRDRVTLIRRNQRVGYIENFRESIEQVCAKPDTLLVVLDQDDALMHREAVNLLQTAWQAGADLINAPMFRPEKPLTLYEVNYEQPRKRGGGNVWSHLRAFRKSLFEQVPKSIWDQAPDPDCLSDFLTMVPMAELAQHPVFLDGPYLYWHERPAYSAERKEREKKVKNWLFSQPSLAD
ncbi:glycosyltransferase [Comamonas testosteroni]|uniref:glycosyltransferase n=1 Tax=Comamonas testosteroni TaxID=285 RepID=UPI00391CA079